MIKRHFEVLLESDTVIKNHGGTVQQTHSCLDYLPGSLFLGVAAASIYGQERDPKTWALFHSGQVRFGNALPLDGQGRVAFPVPHSWHHDKGKAAKTGDRFEADHLVNLAACSAARCPPQKLSQPRQIKEGYVTDAGEAIQPRTQPSLKTAINPSLGRAKDSALFSMESLCKGQRFAFDLTIDEAIEGQDPGALLDELARSLKGRKRLGGSRSAEMGKVMIREIDAPAQPSRDDRWNASHELCLWLLSPAWLVDERGLPADAIDPSRWGLPSGRLDPSRCFRRFRTDVRFNAKYRRFELERHLVEAGSVLVFRLDRPAEQEQLDRLTCGIGGMRQQGLGDVRVNPSLLFDSRPRFSAGTRLEPTARLDLPVEREHPKSSHPLLRWLRQQESDQDRERRAMVRALAWRDELHHCYESARVRYGATPGRRMGPSPSQWNRVRAMAKGLLLGDAILPDRKDMAGTQWKEALVERLCGKPLEERADNRHHDRRQDRPSAICDFEDADWGLVFLLERDRQMVSLSFAEWLAHCIASCEEPPFLELEILAREGQTIAASMELTATCPLTSEKEIDHG